MKKMLKKLFNKNLIFGTVFIASTTTKSIINGPKADLGGGFRR